MSINRVCISGNLTRDAELSSTASGTSILNFCCAVNDHRKKQQSDEWEDYPNFIECTMFGTRAEKLAQYLVKGSKVTLAGRLHYSSWKDKETGKTRSRVGVNVDEVEFMSRGGNGGAAPSGNDSVPVQSAPIDDDVPF